jgi:hypothetical protein
MLFLKVQTLYGCGTQSSTPGASPGVSLFLPCRGGAKREPARVAARRVGTAQVRAIHQRQEDRDWGRLPGSAWVEGQIPGIFRLALSPHSPSQAQGQGPAGSLKMTKGLRSTFRGPEGPLFHPRAEEGGAQSRHPPLRWVSSLFFAVPRRCETGTRKADAAM